MLCSCEFSRVTEPLFFCVTMLSTPVPENAELQSATEAIHHLELELSGCWLGNPFADLLLRACECCSICRIAAGS